MIFPVVCLCLIFFKITFFLKTYFSIISTKCLTVWIQIRSHVLLGMIWVQIEKNKLRPDLGSNCFQRHLQISFWSKNVSQLSGNLFLLINHFLGKKASSYECTRKIVFLCLLSPVFVTMYNVRNNRISDGWVYAQIRKGLSMHLVTCTNRDTVPFLLLVQ